MKPAEIAGFLSGYSGNPAVVLVFGPDEGLVRARIRKLTEIVLGPDPDPFALVSLDTPILIDDIGRLNDEARSIPLLGGRRVIQVRAEGRFPVKVLEPLLQEPPQDAVVLIEADDLGKSAPLRLACEKSANAAVVPCYRQEVSDIRTLVRQRLGAAGLTIDPEAGAYLAAALGADFGLSVSEIDKLALFAHGRDRITIDDVETIIADVGTATPTSVIDLAFSGQLAEIETETNRLLREGIAADTILRAAAAHTLLLLKIVSAPGSTASVLAQQRVHFRRTERITAQSRQWSSDRLDRVFGLLHDANLSIRTRPDLAHAAMVRVMWAIARAATRRG